MADKLHSLFVILSDLHFGSDLGHPFRVPPIDYSRRIRWYLGGADIRSFFESHCEAHDDSILTALPRYLKRLLDDSRDEGFSRESFDLFIILGDVVTFPDENAFNFSRAYLSQSRYATRKGDLELSCPALGLTPSKLIVVPGNHDKLLRRDLSMYYKHFARPLLNCGQPASKSSYFTSRNISGRTFLFVLVEASEYATDELRVDMSARRHLAGGQITPELHSEVKNKLDQLRSNGRVDDAVVLQYESAIRVLLIHYALDESKIPFSRGLKENLKERVHVGLVPHSCGGVPEFLDDVGREFRFAIHGHLHTPKLYNYGGLPIVSVDTTTQHGTRNGFFLLKYFESGAIRAEHHRWNVNAFQPDPTEDLNLPLATAAAI
jgi:3',5'-cyclic AMP phosphodiesterase CpdA